MKLDLYGFGYSIPKKVISNDMLSEIMDTSDEWISKRTGIKERHYSDVNTSTLALDAAKKALKDSNIDPKDIGLLICATITPDSITPSVACMLLDELNINGIMAFDINAACSGFIYALNTASSIMTANNIKYALVVGCEVLSKILDYSDRGTSILFGDGAGAVVIGAEKNDASFICHAKTDVDNVLYAPFISLNDPFKNSTVENHFLHMNGQEVYKFAITSCESIIKEILDKNNLSIDDISYVIPHQANLRIINSFASKLGIDMNKIYVNLDKYGNTSAASVAIALAEAKEKKLIKKGDKLLLVGFGAGLTWAATIIEY